MVVIAMGTTRVGDLAEEAERGGGVGGQMSRGKGDGVNHSFARDVEAQTARPPKGLENFGGQNEAR